ncbi:MAG TPA: GNAT family N-acetyltransferase [Candidatus Dormibacteraeota bacterium]|nr:GNAT family N-acetyltransferase [Candidatus Dormibacteraeota bacterium]
MASLAGITFRPAAEADLLDCHRVWRDALDAYQAPMGIPPMPDDNPGLRRLHRHAHATDPSRFMVAERRTPLGGSRVVAFGSAMERGPMWFLSMLFVEPREQARGLGRALLEQLLPADPATRALATCTDSAQPISNGLYATFGIVPRLPMFNLVGRPAADFPWPPLPAGIRAELVAEPGAMSDGAELGALDRALLGFDHPQDHRFVQAEPRHLFAFRDGSGALAGYGYAGDIGRVGPIAVRDARLLAPVLGHLLTTVVPRGASAVWLPGAAGEAIVGAIKAGLRIEGFPVLAGWSRPFADFSRYVPTSPGLV